MPEARLGPLFIFAYKQNKYWQKPGAKTRPGRFPKPVDNLIKMYYNYYRNEVIT